MRAGDPLLERVRAAIASRLERGDGDVDLAHAASDVGQSERTLQRQLTAAAGCSAASGFGFFTKRLPCAVLVGFAISRG